MFIIKVLPKKTKYCKKRDELLKNYDRVIVTSKKIPDIEGLKVVECNSFNELFDAQRRLKRLINSKHTTKITNVVLATRF